MWFVKTPCNALRHYYLKRLERSTTENSRPGEISGQEHFTDLRMCFIKKTYYRDELIVTLPTRLLDDVHVATGHTAPGTAPVASVKASQLSGAHIQSRNASSPRRLARRCW